MFDYASTEQLHMFFIYNMNIMCVINFIASVPNQPFFKKLVLLVVIKKRNLVVAKYWDIFSIINIYEEEE